MMPDVRGREKSDSGVFLTVPIAVAMNTNCVVREFLDRQDRGDLLVLRERDQIDDRLAARGARPCGTL